MAREDVKKKKPKPNPFFFYVAVEKAMETICSDWPRDKAGRDVCMASGLFGKPGLHLLCVPSPCYLLLLRGFPAAFVCPGSAAPQTQGCTDGSDRLFRGKKARKEKKILSYLSGSQSGRTDPIFSCKDTRQLHLYLLIPPVSSSA